MYFSVYSNAAGTLTKHSQQQRLHTDSPFNYSKPNYWNLSRLKVIHHLSLLVTGMNGSEQILAKHFTQSKRNQNIIFALEICAIFLDKNLTNDFIKYINFCLCCLIFRPETCDFKRKT